MIPLAHHRMGEISSLGRWRRFIGHVIRHVRKLFTAEGLTHFGNGGVRLLPQGKEKRSCKMRKMKGSVAERGKEKAADNKNGGGPIRSCVGEGRRVAWLQKKLRPEWNEPTREFSEGFMIFP